MSTYPTPPTLATTWSPDATRASWTRSIGVALLACVPLPLLSLGGMLLPIPELAQRAAATFAPLAPFLEDEGERVVRQRSTAKPLEIEIAARDVPALASIRTPGSGGALERASVGRSSADSTPERPVPKATVAVVVPPAAPKSNPPTASPPRSDHPAPAEPDAPAAPVQPPEPASDGSAGSAPTGPAPTRGSGDARTGSGKSGPSPSGNENGGSGGRGGSRGSEGQGSSGSPPEHAGGQGKPEAPPGGGNAKEPGKP